MPAAAPPSTLFQAHRAAPGKVPPPSSPLPQTKSRRGQGRLRASVFSPPKWEGVGSGMASAPTRSLPRPPRWPGAPFPPQPETHSSATQQPQPPHRVHAHRHSPYTRAAPPPPAACRRGFRGSWRNHFRWVTDAFYAREIST